MQAEAALLLGQMLFAFSYIDTNLGLCLAWVDNGTKLELLSKSVEGQNIHTKLDTLSRQVAESSRPVPNAVRPMNAGLSVCTLLGCSAIRWSMEDGASRRTVTKSSMSLDFPPARSKALNTLFRN